MTGKYDSARGDISVKIRFDKKSRANFIRQADVEGSIQKAVGGGFGVYYFVISNGFVVIGINSYDASQRAVQKIMITLKNNLQKLIADAQKRRAALGK